MLATVVVALVRTTPHDDRPLARIVAVAVLLAVTVGPGGPRWPATSAIATGSGPPWSRPPRRPVLLCNPWSGGGKVERFGLVEAAGDLGVEVVLLDHGLDLEQLARGAVADGADCLGMAGGDGSQALVASIAVEHGLPFVCISAGTRNHFALDLGLERDDPGHLDAFRDGVERRIDYATVGDRLFVNNVSLGVYATIVQQEGYREAKAETAAVAAPRAPGTADGPSTSSSPDRTAGRSTGPSSSRCRTTPTCSAAPWTPPSAAGSTPGRWGRGRHRPPPGPTPPRSWPSRRWASAA